MNLILINIELSIITQVITIMNINYFLPVRFKRNLHLLKIYLECSGRNLPIYWTELTNPELSIEFMSISN